MATCFVIACYLSRFLVSTFIRGCARPYFIFTVLDTDEEGVKTGLAMKTHTLMKPMLSTTLFNVFCIFICVHTVLIRPYHYTTAQPIYD